MEPTDDQPTVYGPAEDSALLAETATDHVAADDVVLDLGTGSGFVAATVAEATGAAVLGSDLNPHACRAARERGVRTVRADLLEPFPSAAVDVVLFNPPYLPTPPDREWDDWLEHALSGGETGRRVIEPFLADLHRVLRPDGLALLLVSSLTGVDAVRDHARTVGLTTERVASESHSFEELIVLRLRPITYSNKKE